MHVGVIAVEQVEGLLAHLLRQVRAVPHERFAAAQQGLGLVDRVLRHRPLVTVAQAQLLAGIVERHHGKLGRMLVDPGVLAAGRQPRQHDHLRAPHFAVQAVLRQHRGPAKVTAPGVVVGKGLGLIQAALVLGQQAEHFDVVEYPLLAGKAAALHVGAGHCAEHPHR
ncbi:hypothetical protein D3C76_928970 [compost metagenome]